MGFRASNRVEFGRPVRRVRALACPAVTAAAAALALGIPAGAAAAQTLYVASALSGTLTPIDTATNVAGAPIATGSGAEAVAITPDGKTAYVANDGSNTVTPVNTATNVAGASFAVAAGPSAIAISPDGRTAYVTCALCDEVVPFETATNSVGTPIPVGADPQGIAITPDGKTAYVTNIASNDVSVIDLATGTVVATIFTEELPLGIAVTPDGRTAYAVNLGPGTLTPIDTRTNTAGAPINIGLDPNYIAISPDGRTGYVGVEHGVAQFDTASGVVGSEIPVAAGEGIAVTPDGARLYVGNPFTDQVVPIGIAGAIVEPAITVEGFPIGMTVTPSQAPAAAFSSEGATAGQPASFDASASSGEGTPIGTYRWEFGDGSSASTSLPTTTHVYSAPGTYSVALTLTNSEGCSTTFIYTGQTALCNGSSRASTVRSVTIAAPPSPAHPSQAVLAPPLVGSALAPPVVSDLAARKKCVIDASLASGPTAGSGGLAFSYTLNEPASVLYVIKRRAESAGRARCGPAAGRDAGSYTEVASTRGPGAQGQNGVSLGTGARAAGARGRLSTGARMTRVGLRAGRHSVTLAQIAGAKALAPGTYVLMVRATNSAGERSYDANVKFFVLSR